MGLDWDAPAFSDIGPAGRGTHPLPPLRVDLGPLAGHSQHFTDAPLAVLERYTTRLENEPNDADSLHHRARPALHNLKRFHDAVDELTRAIHLRPADGHFHAVRGSAYFELRQFEPAIADLEAALAHGADQYAVRQTLAVCCRASSLGAGQRPRARARSRPRSGARTPGCGPLALRARVPQCSERRPLPGGPVPRGHRLHGYASRKSTAKPIRPPSFTGPWLTTGWDTTRKPAPPLTAPRWMSDHGLTDPSRDMMPGTAFAPRPKPSSPAPPASWPWIVFVPVR